MTYEAESVGEPIQSAILLQDQRRLELDVSTLLLLLTENPELLSLLLLLSLLPEVGQVVRVVKLGHIVYLVLSLVDVSFEVVVQVLHSVYHLVSPILLNELLHRSISLSDLLLSLFQGVTDDD